MKLGLIRRARRMARKNPLGLPEEIVIGSALLGVIVGGAYLWRKYGPSSAGSAVGPGKSWVEITSSPAIKAGTVYRVTMAPLPGTTEDQGLNGFNQFSDPAQGGGPTVWDAPFDSTWADQDGSRWHFMFLATTTLVPTLDSSSRIWAFQ